MANSQDIKAAAPQPVSDALVAEAAAILERLANAGAERATLHAQFNQRLADLAARLGTAFPSAPAPAPAVAPDPAPVAPAAPFDHPGVAALALDLSAEHLPPE